MSFMAFVPWGVRAVEHAGKQKKHMARKVGRKNEDLRQKAKRLGWAWKYYGDAQ
jgi:hypothetical protein